jgi:hypothetical protein
LTIVHGITQHGNKKPINPLDKHVKATWDTSRQPIIKKDTINVVTTIHAKPFTDALIYWCVIARLSFSLVTSSLFFDFLKLLYPAIDKTLPHASNSIRKYIIEKYEAKKEAKKEELAKVQGMVHFSFDL